MVNHPFRQIFIAVLILALIFPAVVLMSRDYGKITNNPWHLYNFRKQGRIPDPLLQRAIAFQDKGKLKISVGNWGLLTGTGYSPEGLWGNYQYLPVISILFGVPGRDRNGNPYPWAVGTKMVYDREAKDLVPLGTDTTYWGPTVSESWFDRTPNLDRTDWEAVENSTTDLHGEATAGQYYGNVWTFPDDQFPLIATSDIIDSWPIGIDSLGNETRFWPGPWATDTTGQELPNVFVSDQDIYFEVDDRLATRDVDPFQGYPIGVRALVSSYSYGAAVAEDIVFFNMRLVNESQYTYERAYGGFYFDADIYHRLANGSYAGRTNDDDMMGYNTDWDFAYIYDLDGVSSGYTGLAWVGLKLLDTPFATEPVDLDNDGVPDIQVGEKLGLTDWHYFDWYFRPGARDAGPSGPFSGDGETPVAEDKEAIQYKIMAGDTSSTDSNPFDHNYNMVHYFFEDPLGNLNPHFDSFARLKADYPDGLDCVFIMSSGPFTFAPGDTIPFSFAVIAGKDSVDLVANAEVAQLMYDNFYRGPTPPDAPHVTALEEYEKVTLFWDDVSINSRDALTKIKDFEGFRIYKSTDNGQTWGEKRVDDSTGVEYWTPIAQFDLDNEIKGHDPTAPHRFLGSNTGLRFEFTDTDVKNGFEYLYAVCAYDRGFVPGDPLRDSVAVTGGRFNFRVPSLENFLSSSDRLPHIVRAIPHAPPANVRQSEVEVKPLPGTIGNGDFEVRVVDNTKITGHIYKLAFHSDVNEAGVPIPSNVTYDLVDSTSGDTLMKRSKDYLTDEGEFKTIPPRLEGLEWKIIMATRVKVDTNNVEWSKGSPTDYKLVNPAVPPPSSDTSNLNQVSLADYYLIWNTANPDTVYARQIVGGKPRLGPPIFSVPFHMYNKRTGQQVDFVTAPALDLPPRGEFSPGDKFLVWESHLPGFAPSSVKQTFQSLTFDWAPEDVYDERGNLVRRKSTPPRDGDTLYIPLKKPFLEGDGFIVNTKLIYDVQEPTQEDLKKVRVVPNPYIVSAAWEFDEFNRKIQFVNLPSKCKIYIFNVAGELVQILDHDNPYDGSENWNLWTLNRQEVAPGLYIWVVETPDGKKEMGKFTIIR